MLTFVLRWGALVIAVGVAAMSWISWRTGEPPNWSIISPRVEVQVMEARVDSERVGNGTTRYRPVVIIDAGDGEQRLPGVQPAFFGYSTSESEAILERYDVGETTRVRRVNGVLMADRTDFFQMAHALFLSFMTLLVGGIGVVMAIAMGKHH